MIKSNLYWDTAPLTNVELWYRKHNDKVFLNDNDNIDYVINDLSYSIDNTDSFKTYFYNTESSQSHIDAGEDTSFNAYRANSKLLIPHRISTSYNYPLLLNSNDSVKITDTSLIDAAYNPSTMLDFSDSLVSTSDSRGFLLRKPFIDKSKPYTIRFLYRSSYWESIENTSSPIMTNPIFLSLTNFARSSGAISIRLSDYKSASSLNNELFLRMLNPFTDYSKRINLQETNNRNYQSTMSQSNIQATGHVYGAIDDRNPYLLNGRLCYVEVHINPKNRTFITTMSEVGKHPKRNDRYINSIHSIPPSFFSHSHFLELPQIGKLTDSSLGLMLNGVNLSQYVLGDRIDDLSNYSFDSVLSKNGSFICDMTDYCRMGPLRTNPLSVMVGLLGNDILRSESTENLKWMFEYSGHFGRGAEEITFELRESGLSILENLGNRLIEFPSNAVRNYIGFINIYIKVGEAQYIERDRDLFKMYIIQWSGEDRHTASSSNQKVPADAIDYCNRAIYSSVSTVAKSNPNYNEFLKIKFNTKFTWAIDLYVIPLDGNFKIPRQVIDIPSKHQSGLWLNKSRSLAEQNTHPPSTTERIIPAEDYTNVTITEVGERVFKFRYEGFNSYPLRIEAIRTGNITLRLNKEYINFSGEEFEFTLISQSHLQGQSGGVTLSIGSMRYNMDIRFNFTRIPTNTLNMRFVCENHLTDTNLWSIYGYGLNHKNPQKTVSYDTPWSQLGERQLVGCGILYSGEKRTRSNDYYVTWQVNNHSQWAEQIALSDATKQLFNKFTNQNEWFVPFSPGNFLEATTASGRYQGYYLDLRFAIKDANYSGFGEGDVTLIQGSSGSETNTEPPYNP